MDSQPQCNRDATRLAAGSRKIGPERGESESSGREDRAVAGWSEKEGHVSDAFNDWRFVEADQRSFLRLGLKFSRESYARIWREAGEEPWYDDGPEQLDVFQDRVDGLHEADFEWMHLAGVLREAVTGFEVYLEKAREEVLRHQGRPTEIAERSPHWHILVDFFAKLGAEVNSEKVEAVRTLRHFLAHRRGELRTAEQRERFAPSDPRWALNAELSESQVLRDMDVLSACVRVCDARVYGCTWGDSLS